MRDKALDFPKSILIETLNKCQGQCKFCPYDEIRIKEKPIYLDYEKYKEMIKEISKYDVKRLTLFNNNEPLIDYRIYDFINYAYKYLSDTEITLSTNGRMLSRKVLMKLKECGLTHLYISIPTVNEEKYKEVMGTNLTPIINQLIEIEDSDLLKMIRIAAPKTKYFNYDEIKEKLGKFLICVWNLEYRETWNIDKKIEAITNKLEYTGPCDRPLDQMVISSNGNVIICCRDWLYENVIGNIYENNLYDIWHSSKMLKIQDLIINQKYDSIDCCKDCNMNISFYKAKVRRKIYEKK